MIKSLHSKDKAFQTSITLYAMLILGERRGPDINAIGHDGWSGGDRVWSFSGCPLVHAPVNHPACLLTCEYRPTSSSL